MLRYSRQTISKKDIEGVTSVLRSDFLTQGPKVPEFEKKIIKYTSARYCAAVNSASSALYIACKVLKLKNNDIIWTVTNSFVASANCILLSGHKIDFVDIDNETWNISLDKLEKKLVKTKRNKKLPKAVIIVHLGGLPVDPKKIKLLSKKYKFKIIEDASHSIGSEYYGEKVGSCKWSDMCVFSFHPVKIITTGEGGCVMTNNKIYYERMKLIRNNGITNETKNFKHKKIGPWYYEQQDIGFNFRMNDMQAALGISQLKRINLFVRLRNKIADIYKKELKELPLNFQRIDKYYLSSYHLFIIKIKNKIIYKSFFEYLRKNKIFTNLHYLPIHMHPFYQNLGYKKNDFPNSENYSSQALSIPIYPNLKYKDQFKVINLIKNFFKKNNK
jgi:UDP-4-amino-4,6-dideoxy-N-acetyl-beta-L-altrosamine transaminase